MIIVKIGGGDTINLPGIVEDLADLEGECVVVHGANGLRRRLATRLGTELEILTSVSGYESVKSTDELIDLMLMSYAGLRNKRLVELCQQAGLPAIGLTGLDGGLVRGQRNPGIRAVVDGRRLVVRDHSGKPREVNTGLLRTLLDQGYLPLLTVPISDEEGRAINTENDDVVRLLHRTLEADTVVQLIEAPGLLADARDHDSLIHDLDRPGLARAEEEAEGRMRRKLLALGRMLDAAPCTIHIADGRRNHPLRDALAGEGTRVAA